MNCKIFKQCGSCDYLHLAYEEQLRKKREYCVQLVKKAKLSQVKVADTIGAQDPYHYRNKVIVGFNQRNEAGFYEENSHKIIPYTTCLLHDEESDAIIQKIASLLRKYKIQIYNEDRRKGFLRHVLIRRGIKTNQTMVVLVTTSSVFPGSKNFVKELTSQFKSIKTIVMNINTRKTSIVLGNDEKILFGKGYIEDELCGLKFKISPKSFYQINRDQCEVLYNKALSLLDLKGSETVIDTYCGIGTIGMVASKKAKQVIGVELNKDAVKDAIYNAKMNNIKNIRFINEDATAFMVELAKEKVEIDAVIMDPPRSGTTPAFINAVKALKPKQVVYISCDPSTQVRDLGLFKEAGYAFDTMIPVDMFPMTEHVETAVLLVKKP
ncbi:MAG: 23S rRNA (uracil(1939)-C(5))-methyltransferase RlmD [Beduini sp.]|uniref:23S rRNA (uracil(1939)-C(5))-methyltransferase RlmD n=1 Tax=Beduini sp. TaxID=1922300 RepID=UPI0039A3DAB0